MTEPSLNVAVQGCCHGELDKIYKTILDAETQSGQKIDLLLICGDFECVRDIYDLECVAVPPKYRKLNCFQHYVTGQRVAPVLTIFIGGNHEASNVLQSLYFGGWVAPNIYFLGFAGVVWYKGLRISGLSGIYNNKHYLLGHFEKPPYTDSSLRSVYHIRELEIYRMAHLTGQIDAFLSHDWPTGIVEYGDKQRLLHFKKFLAPDIENGSLGSPPLMQLLHHLKPQFWFAAHLHVKFEAVVPHFSPPEDLQSQTLAQLTNDNLGSAPPPTSFTRFLALDKVLPGRDFIQFLTIPIQPNQLAHMEHKTCRAPPPPPPPPTSTATAAPVSMLEDPNLYWDVEWLAVLRRTHSLLSTRTHVVRMPTSVTPVSPEELQGMKERVLSQWGDSSVRQYEPQCLPSGGSGRSSQLSSVITDSLLALLEKSHIWTVPSKPVTPIRNPAPSFPTGPPPPPPLYFQEKELKSASAISKSNRKDPNEISISDDEAGFEKAVAVKDPNEISISDDDQF